MLTDRLTGSSLAFAEPPKEITVSAALSLKNAFEEIGKIYEAKNSELAGAFIALAISPEGKRILEKYGFKAVR